jgi:predicted enzyme related to lactoylglutathione lyase
MAAPGTGRFVWHELRTSDRRGALDFYCMLLAWRTREVLMGAGPYGLCFLDDRDHAGIVEWTGPPYWLPYLAVDDVDVMVARAERLGGRMVSPPTDIPNVGRNAVLADPHGAMFAVHRYAMSQPMEFETAPVGSFGWEELATHDPEEAAAFYAALFGFAVERVNVGRIATCHILKRGTRPTAGIMPLATDAPRGSRWLTYLQVKDVDRTVRNAKEIGATIQEPACDLPGVGRFAVLVDPTGAAFGVVRGAPQA